MSSATVRAALYSYFNGGNLAGLRKIYQAEPWWVNGQTWNFAIDLGSASVGFLHLAADSESRNTVPAISGQKAVHYSVVFYVIYQYLIAPSDTSEDDWAGPLDATIDAVKALIRADPNCGLPSTIFQAGQDDNDIAVKRGDPFLLGDGGSLGSWTSIEFKVTEIITA